MDFQAPTSRTPDGVETALQWTCRTRRTFAAIAGDERSAPLTVTTPRCEERLKVSARPDVGVGDDLRISVVDRWSLGNLTADVCVTPPGGDPRCAGVELPPDQDIAHAVFRASVAGRWRIEATTPIGTFKRSVTIVRHHYPRGGPTVLFTGDSMMLATRHVLQRRLPRTARMIDDIYVGSGITRPFAIDWAKLPARQVHAYRPDATVISLGMSDGRAIKDVRCCGTDWIAAYARRVRTLMRTYTRNGDGAVVWLNVPFSRNPDRWPQEAAVNAAVALAAHGLHARPGRRPRQRHDAGRGLRARPGPRRRAGAHPHLRRDPPDARRRAHRRPARDGPAAPPRRHRRS